ncbi:helix-turn-helix domain-containing protein [Planktomarina sp.]|jgi:transcriptional regulator with XRE-family HTH domain|nr:helix-turn-helix transcriptional regulator [Planktomarina sp.]MBT3619986.1 helix-turn-helix transcriptional regulator [Porticoccaceae bacterium]MDB4841610.1 helix-turn-helix domain-containing protein [Planktomarina sp.]
MLEFEIKSERLKAVRKARKIGRPKLAKQVGITERQLFKIETSETVMLTENAVSKLCQALQINIKTLTGELPMLEKDLRPLQKPQCVSGCCS